MTVIIPSLCIGGYRSFGPVQRAPVFSKLNVFIGANNSGKSNILKFLHSKFPKIGDSREAMNFERYERPVATSIGLKYGFAVDLRASNGEHAAFLSTFDHLRNGSYPYRHQALGDLLAVMRAKAALDQTPEFAWFEFNEQHTVVADGWDSAFGGVDHRVLNRIGDLVGFKVTGGQFVTQILDRLRLPIPRAEPLFIPAVRWVQPITQSGTQSERVFGGFGLIDKLDKLSRPDADAYAQREIFDKIERFVQIVTSNPSARLEIPASKSSITVHISDKPLPLESLGTGIHEVVILAAACTLFGNHVICLEEPELHLNPILLRKLIRYLLDETSNQYFISTHAAALMDTDEAEVYHVRLDGGNSILSHAKSGNARSSVCADLGYHPSDLLQCNCLIWVEGPSDRLYLKYWLSKCQR